MAEASRNKFAAMLETERLLIRKFTDDDLPALIEQRSDAEVNKYLGGTRLQNPDEIAKRLKFYIGCYEKYGFGMCAMIWKETGEFFGWSGLQPLDDESDIEVGYGMKRAYWRKGIGFECARAWLEFGFKEMDLKRIVAVAVPENNGSWRIMEKLGMKFEKTEPHYDMDCVFYSIAKEDFLDKLPKIE